MVPMIVMAWTRPYWRTCKCDSNSDVQPVTSSNNPPNVVGRWVGDYEYLY